MGNEQTALLSTISDKYKAAKINNLSLSPISKRHKFIDIQHETKDNYSLMDLILNERDEDDELTQSNSIRQVKTFTKKTVPFIRKQHKLKTNILPITNYEKFEPLNKSIFLKRSNSTSSLPFNPFLDEFYNESESSSFSLHTEDIEETNSFVYKQPNSKANELRFSYFTKLITRNPENINTNYIIKCTNSKKSMNRNFITKTIFDFDSVFFNMQYIVNSELHKLNTNLTLKQSEQFSKIEFTLLRLLNLSLEKGEVFIFTNSSLQWVDYAIEKFYPSLMRLKHHLKFISCKMEYKHRFPNESKLWKVKSMKKILYLLSTEDMTTFKIINCLYFGNLTLNENDLKLKTTNFDYVLKNVKVNTSSNLDHLNKQLLLIIKEYMKIHSIAKSTNIKIECKVKH